MSQKSSNVKHYRVYYNRSEDAPQIWSVDEGSHASEINVQRFQITTGVCPGSDLKAILPEPKAWISAYGVLTISDGCAYIDSPEKA